VQIKIDDATATQLANFAAAKGLEGVNFRMGVFEIRKRLVEAGWTHDYINVEDGAANAPVRATEQPMKPDDPYEQLIEVYIQQTEEPGGRDPVFVGHNGTPMLIERGKWSPIKRKYLECLSHAIKIVIDPVPMDASKSMDTGGTLPPREVPSYPFRTREVASTDLEAWSPR
jgi:hypothetical protein